MARTAIKGIAAFVLSVVVVLVSLWVIPGDRANAADPIPGPVDAIPDLPSRTIKMTPTWSEAKAATIWRAMLTYTSSEVATIPPKPITPASPIARGAAVGGAAAGTVLVGFQGGWALGQGGLMMYAAATGQDYQGLVCGAGDWYAGANDFIMLGLAPDCGGTYSAVDEGSIMANSTFSYGGWTATYLGRGTAVASGQLRTNFCWGTVGTLPAGVLVRFVYPPENTFPTSSSGTACFAFFGGDINTPYARATVTGDSTLVPRLQLRQSTTTGPILAEQSAYPSEVPAEEALRTPTCTIMWDDGSTTSGAGDAYTQQQPFPASAPGLGCTNAWDAKPGAGIDTLPSRIKVDETDEAGGIRTISDNEVPPMTQQERDSLTVPGNGRGLVLEKVVGGGLQSCMTWEADCVGWWEATSEGTVTGTYRCTYAGAVVELAECGPYRHTFDTRTGTPTITDPVTGEAVQWSAQPNTGNSLNPGTGPGTGANPADACFETGWASVANPVDWVLVPIKCALVWAFVPRTQVVETETNRTYDGWKNTFPVKGMEAGLAAVAALQTFDVGGCEGPHIYWEINWPAPIVWDAHPLNACGPPYDFLALVSNVVISLLAIGYTVWGLTRRVGAVVSAPGLGPGS